MAVLKHLPRISVLLSVLFLQLGGPLAQGHIEKYKLSRSDLVYVGSWRALKNCDWSKAAFWADLVSKVQPQASVLYRLSWFQVARQPAPQIDSLQNHTDPTEGPTEKTTWPWTSELWKDEWDLISNSNLCTSPPSQTPAGQSSLGHPEMSFSELPESVVDPLLLPYLDSFSSLHPPFQRVLTSYLLFKWLNGKKLELRKLTGQCDWEALRLIHSQSEDVSEFDHLSQSCPAHAGHLWSIFRIRFADLLLQKGKARDAFALFRSAYDNIPDRKMPEALEYRMAVSGFLSQAPDDLSFRLAYKLLTDSEPNRLEPLYRSTLQNLVCENLTSLNPKEAIKTLSLLFRTQSFLQDVLALTRDCSSQDMEPLLKGLISKVKTPRERILLLGRLLKSALARNSVKEAKAIALSLAKLSHQTPLWLHLVEQKLKRLQSHSTEDSIQTGDATFDSLIPEHEEAKSSVRLPIIATSLPEVKWPTQIPTSNFIESYREETQISPSTSP